MLFYPSATYEFEFEPGQDITKEGISEVLNAAHSKRPWASQRPYELLDCFVNTELYEERYPPDTRLFMVVGDILNGQYVTTVTVTTHPNYCIKGEQIHAYTSYAEAMFSTLADCEAYQVSTIRVRAHFSTRTTYRHK